MSSFKRKAEATSTQDPKKAKKDGSLTSFFTAKPANAPATTTAAATGTAGGATPAAEAPTIKFNKEKWVASLTPEQKALLKLEIDTLDISWLAHLKDELTTPRFLDLKRFLKKEIDAGKTIFPPMEDVYSWSRHTPLHKVRVVLIGQDPYHNHNQAHGLCFSVRPPTPAPPSLKNMYIALRNDYPDFKAPPTNRGGLLTPWAEQGVLMLNTALTVAAHQAGSHSDKGWEVFTQKVIDTVVKVRSRGVVFLAWGAHAAKRCAKINSSSGNSKHLVLKSVHPSPLSASRGFFDCGHFKKTNEWLAQRYGEDGQINWNLDGSTSTSTSTSSTSKKTNEVAITETTTTTAAAATTTTSTDKKSDDNHDVDKDEENTKTDNPPDNHKHNNNNTNRDDDDEFNGEDDLDAIQALEEIARSSQPDGK